MTCRGTCCGARGGVQHTTNAPLPLPLLLGPANRWPAHRRARALPSLPPSLAAGRCSRLLGAWAACACCRCTAPSRRQTSPRSSPGAARCAQLSCVGGGQAGRQAVAWRMSPRWGILTCVGCCACAAPSPSPTFPPPPFPIPTTHTRSPLCPRLAHTTSLPPPPSRQAPRGRDQDRACHQRCRDLHHH